MKTKEELIQRALTTTNMSSFIHEDLSDLIEMVTPRDVPLYRRLGRNRATASLHEWRERSLHTPGAGAYNSETGLPAANTNNGTDRDNKVMTIGYEAVATNFLQKMDTVGKSVGQNAFALEMEEKMQNVMRDIEYFTFKGNRTNTNPQEMDGIERLAASFNQVSNSASGAIALTEAAIQTAMVKSFENGGVPNAIYCLPTVAQRIASFNSDKIRLTEGGGAQGQRSVAFKYLSPFGYELEVVPIRPDFMSSGSVYIVDESKIKYSFLSDGIEVTDLPIQGDHVARKLIKAYLTLELRALSHHTRITGVSSALS